MLTLVRLIIAPLLLPILLVNFLPFNDPSTNWLLALCFFAFGLTDFLDGYLARKFKQETMLGRILDPMADKFLVYSVLIALLAVGKIYFYWVLLFIGREFFVMGLRHIALENNLSLSVSFLAKLKTCAQIAYLTIVIANTDSSLGVAQSLWWNGTESLLLMLSLFLSLFSALKYYLALVDACTKHRIIE